MKERIITRCREELGELHGMAEMYVGTIHAFCLELLKSEVPKYLKFDVLNEVQQSLFIDRLPPQSTQHLARRPPIQPRSIWRIIRAISAQLPALSEQLAGNVPSNTGECPHHGYRTARRRLGNCLSSPRRGHEADRLSSKSRSRNVRFGVRATSDESSREFPGSVWAIPHETRSGQEISKDIPRSFTTTILPQFFVAVHNPRLRPVRKLSTPISSPWGAVALAG